MPGSSEGEAGRVAVVVPARFASTRYPGKPLVPTPRSRTRGAAGGRAAPDGLVYVATDDDRIRAAAEDFGAQVLMTPESCANGTERCAAALAQLPEDVEIVVNLQGDAPLPPPAFGCARGTPQRSANSCLTRAPGTAGKSSRRNGSSSP